MEDSDHVSLSLRLALLESLTLGDTRNTSTALKEPLLLNSTLFHRSSNAQVQLLQSIDKYKPIVQFVNHYKSNQTYLQPTASTANMVTEAHLPSTSGNEGERKEGEEKLSSISLLSPTSIISLLLEAEADLRQLDRDLRKCEHHYEKGTAGAGKLADYEPLARKLAPVQQQMVDNQQQIIEVEKRVVQLMDTYSIQIDAMSKLFINWDQVLTQTEDALTRLERSQNK